MEKPGIIRGAKHVDARGVVTYNNDLSLFSVQRAYLIENSVELPFRGWHGHQLESKYFLAIKGSLRFGAVMVRDWSNPDPNEEVVFADLTESSMDAFYVPGGFANGVLSLEPGSQALVFSSMTLAESLHDDYRIDSNFWRL